MQSKKLNLAIEKLESHLENYKVSNNYVSKTNVAWHLDHSLKVINSVIKTLQSSDPSTYKANFSILGRVFFTLGFFPRGKAKAPKYVTPPETIVKEDIISQLDLAKSNVKIIDNLDKNAYFKHPIFGNVNTTKVHRFLILHTNHHLKIIDDIVRK